MCLNLRMVHQDVQPLKQVRVRCRMQNELHVCEMQWLNRGVPQNKDHI
jgi:hypothetical protein